MSVGGLLWILVFLYLLGRAALWAFRRLRLAWWRWRGARTNWSEYPMPQEESQVQPDPPPRSEPRVALRNGDEVRLWSWLLHANGAGPNHVGEFRFHQERGGQLDDAVRAFRTPGFRSLPSSHAGKRSMIWIDASHYPRWATEGPHNIWVYAGFDVRGDRLRFENGYGSGSEDDQAAQTRLLHHLVTEVPGLRLVGWYVRGDESGEEAAGQTAEELLDYLQGSSSPGLPSSQPQ